MRVVVFGRRGQLARAMAGLLDREGYEVVALGQAEIDLFHPAGIAAALDSHRPVLVVNAAAWTAVDRAEEEPCKAFALNATAVETMARACAERGVPLIHVSTDYVFDGRAGHPYRETDAPAPVSVYGRSKLAGEEAVRALCPDHLILRTSWLFSASGHTFVRTMLRLGEDREDLRVVADQHGCPTAATDLVHAALALFDRASGTLLHKGTLHYAGGPSTTWHAFAEEIFALRREMTGRPPPMVHAITTAEFAAAARRPANSVLDCTRFHQITGRRPAPWRPALRSAVADLLGVGQAEEVRQGDALAGPMRA